MVNQFRNADGTEAKLYMKDLKVNQTWAVWDGGTGFQPGADTVQIFNDEGQVKVALSYATAEYMEEGSYEGPNKPGWYPAMDLSDYVFDNPADDEYVPFGNGYVVKAGTGEGVLPTLTFSGEVKKGISEIPGQPFCFSGNCTPVATTMGMIKCNQTWAVWDGGTGFQPGSDTVQIFSPEGQVSIALSYACAEYMEEGSYEGENKPGWYPATDLSDYIFDNPQASYPVPAGSGFVYKTGNGEGVWPTITIPAALPEEK